MADPKIPSSSYSVSPVEGDSLSATTFTGWVPPKKGPGCPDCLGKGEVLFLIERPGGPPGNQMVPCPKCGFGFEEGE